MESKYEREIDLFAKKEEEKVDLPAPKPDGDIVDAPGTDLFLPGVDKIDYFDVDVETETKEEESKSAEEDLAIAFSIKVIDMLKEKRKEHNKENEENKVTLSQLKKVYKSGADQARHEKGLWALARVHLFLELKSGRLNKQSYDLGIGVDGAPTRRVDQMKLPLDLSAGWIPSDEDFLKAEEDLKKYELDYNFDDVDELYLDDASDFTGLGCIILGRW